MLSRIRVFPLVLMLLFVTFTLRLGDFMYDLVSGQPAKLESAEAMANEPAEKKEEAKGGKEGEEEGQSARQEIPAKSDKEVAVKGIDDIEDPFSDGYSDEEVKSIAVFG